MAPGLADNQAGGSEIPDGDRAPDTLATLSLLAGRGFASTEESMAAVLELIPAQTGMRSSFATRYDRNSGEFRVLATHNQPGGCDVTAGAASLQDTF